ncbi:MAG TPA: 5'-nucleotidase C-terminal domain-containing protein, partial [Segetibacter sp.]
PVSQYDIIRSLPFGGGITEVDMKGSMLVQVLQTGMKNRNSGGFLQFQPVVYSSATHSFILNNAPIDLLKTYRVAVTDFLFSGKETNLSFLQPKNPDIIKTYPVETSIDSPKSDIRRAIIKYLESRK